MPSLNVVTNELNNVGAGIPNNTGVAFVVGITDAGPPVGGAAYVKGQSISDYTSAFGPRTSTSSVLYDWLDEFFHDSGGGTAYVSRVTDNTAATAALTLSDATPHPSIVVSAKTPGTNGNTLYVVVTVASGVTFTATTSNSVNPTILTAVSSVANLLPGTLLTGAGIPAGTYITAVGTNTVTMSASATATAVGITVTPSTFTVLIEDSAGDVLETHGPYYAPSALYADTTSTLVTFTQSAGSGFTINSPVAVSLTALTGGADPNDLTTASYVTALANFPVSLGPGTVAIPGQVGSTIWTGLLAHAAANNRYAAMDMTDSANVAAIISAIGNIGATPNAGWGMFIQGSLILPGITPGTTRTVAGSAAIAALRAQVGQQQSQNQNPSGQLWPLQYPLGFTEYFGPTTSSALPGGSFQQADVNTLSTAGINVFANYYGTLCLFGFVTPVSRSIDSTFWQGTASVERMALVADCNVAAAPFLFSTIDGANSDTTAQQTALKAVINRHWLAKALFGDNASDAGAVNVGSPINTPTTEAAGQLNANLQVRMSPYADTVNISITTVPITQSVA